MGKEITYLGSNVWHVVEKFPNGTVITEYDITESPQGFYQCGEAIVDGNAVMLVNGLLYKNSITTTTTENKCIGIANANGALNEWIEVIEEGGNYTKFTGLTAGSLYFGDPNSAGTLTVTKPAGFAQIIGIAKSTIFFQVKLRSGIRPVFNELTVNVPYGSYEYKINTVNTIISVNNKIIVAFGLFDDVDENIPDGISVWGVARNGSFDLYITSNNNNSFGGLYKFQYSIV